MSDMFSNHVMAGYSVKDHPSERTFPKASRFSNCILGLGKLRDPLKMWIKYGIMKKYQLMGGRLT